MRGDDGEVITYVDERDVKFVPVPGLYLRLCLPSPRISAPVAFRPLLSCARNYASEATFRVQKALRAHHEPRALKEERTLFLVECLLTYKRDWPMPWQRIAFCGRLWGSVLSSYSISKLKLLLWSGGRTNAVRLSERQEMFYRRRLRARIKCDAACGFHFESRSDKRDFVRTYKDIYRKWLVPISAIHGLSPCFFRQRVSRETRNAV